jgi:hypothetical protein
MTKHRYTVTEFVTKENGRVRYVDLSELSDDALIAEVKVVMDADTHKEVSRDQVVPDEAWMTVKEYYEKK